MVVSAIGFELEVHFQTECEKGPKMKAWVLVVF